jgi:hypothetical protein
MDHCFLLTVSGIQQTSHLLFTACGPEEFGPRFVLPSVIR